MVFSLTHEIGFAILAILLLVAAISDTRHYVIPNWLTAGVAVMFAVSLLAHPFSPTQIGLHLVAGFLMLLVGFLLFARDLFGGGDVKLIAALALWTGFSALPRFLLLTALAGGVLALTLLLARRLTIGPGKALDRRLPYGVAIAVGGLDFCFQQHHIIARWLN